MAAFSIIVIAGCGRNPALDWKSKIAKLDALTAEIQEKGALLMKGDTNMTKEIERIDAELSKVDAEIEEIYQQLSPDEKKQVEQARIQSMSKAFSGLTN
jgi:Skp family chaperone for outer membrane proteins